MKPEKKEPNLDFNVGDCEKEIRNICVGVIGRFVEQKYIRLLAKKICFELYELEDEIKKLRRHNEKA